jgi:hypothetical protein
MSHSDFCISHSSKGTHEIDFFSPSLVFFSRLYGNHCDAISHSLQQQHIVTDVDLMVPLSTHTCAWNFYFRKTPEPNGNAIERRRENYENHARSDVNLNGIKRGIFLASFFFVVSEQ